MGSWVVYSSLAAQSQALSVHNPPASVLPHNTHHFHSVCRKDVQCSEFSTGGFLYTYFGGDPFTGDAPHDRFMRQVLHHNGASCGTVHNRTAQRAPDVINLKLHHKQMHYRRSPFLNVFIKKTTTKVVKNMLPGHEKLKICLIKSHLG